MAILTGSTSAGGSISSGTSSAQSYSNTYGTAATQAAIQAANNANSSATSAWREAAEYNAAQAALQREWQERMANTVYQRTVKDMKAAGINPILAAQMGLSTASVGSGATASMSTPNTYMANTFADQNSASTANSKNNGSSWENSESGLATALTQLAAMFTGVLDKMATGQTVNNFLNTLTNGFGNDYKNSPTAANSKTSKNGRYYGGGYVKANSQTKWERLKGIK